MDAYQIKKKLNFKVLNYNYILKKMIEGVAGVEKNSIIFQFKDIDNNGVKYYLTSPYDDVHYLMVSISLNLGDEFLCGRPCSIPSERKIGQLVPLKGSTCYNENFEFNLRLQKIETIGIQYDNCFPWFCNH